ncbi:CoA ester lyase [Variovorax sp. Sphag1AA]|uniref:HpcH/HpaI aldolase/citrate lyase family protein n=1 Tax=Variovorax sp. Sphag1AA TaxID=2587027 RepID=UPI0017BE7DB4|nr:CoA ester lyase [Variovorax sp. Sphag1AA]MBB3180928.1 citrate lyase subunit beta/citryl-CoA lyase [Variovorax sp. Sphag1AA]
MLRLNVVRTIKDMIRITMNTTTPVTYLFVPADRPERFSKAAGSGADIVVLDLEDAVGVDHKAAAREHARAALASGVFKACVRINGIDTEWFAEDCALLSLPGVAAVMLPKAETVEGIAAVRAARRIVPLVETAKGLAVARELARCAGVAQLAFGSVDFQQDLGIEGDGDELLFARSELVLASKLAGIAAPVDGVSLAVKDLDVVSSEALRARRLGFASKLCIHPAQIASVRAAFAPDDKAVAWARGVLAAAASTSGGALSFEGQMVDKPLLERARGILSRAEAAAA